MSLTALCNCLTQLGYKGHYLLFAMRLFSVPHGHSVSMVCRAHVSCLEHGNRAQAVLTGATKAL